MRGRRLIAILIAFALVIALLPNYTSRAEDVQGEVVESSPGDADEEIVEEPIDESSESIDQEIQKTPMRIMKLLRPAALLLGDASDTSGYTLIFTVQAGTTHTIAKNGERLSIDGGIVELHDESNTEIPTTITVNSESSATMEVPAGKTGKLNYGGNKFTLYANGQPFSIDTEITGAMSFAVQDYEDNPGPGPGPGPDPGAEGDSEAIIRLTGPDGNWEVKPMVTEDYDIVSDEGCSAPYNKYCYTTTVGINGGQKTQGLNQYSKDADVSRFDKQYAKYNPSGDGTTVSIDFSHNWADRIESITINGVKYDDVLPNYDDRYEWLSHFGGQGYNFSIDNIPVPLVPADGSSAENVEEGRPVFNIEIKSRPITEEECYIGNFLWSNDDRLDPEVVGYYDDMYIGHSHLELMTVRYNDGKGEKVVDIDEIGDTVNYLHCKEDTNYEGYEYGEMVVPEGSWVTMKIETDYGYQVKSFDINGESINIGEEASVFSFKVGKGNFHIGAHVEEQEDEVRNESDSVDAAIVELASGTLDAGTARLSIDDAELSAVKEEEFEDIADAQDLDIENVLDISLDQVFFKGTGSSDDVWENPMEDLEEPANIGLDLDEDFTGKDVYVIHNVHDGENFEVYEAEVVDATEGQIIIPADSFSSYAIATKLISSTPANEDKEATVTPSKDANVTPADEDKEATVTPSKDANVTPAAESKTTEVRKSSKPATSDDFNLVLISVLVAASAAGIVFIIRRKRLISVAL